MSGEEEYFAKRRKSIMIAALAVIPMVLITVYSISVSLFNFSFAEAIDIVIRHLEGRLTDDYRDYLLNSLVFEGTLPRGIGCVIVGAILGIGGAVMQYIVRNPLADPYTTGISSGALFGASLFFIMDISILGFTGDLGLTVNAMVFSLVPCLIISMFAIKKRVTPTMMVLIGIATMYMFSAASMLLKYNADPEDLRAVYEWSLGSMYKVDWGNIPVLLGSLGVLAVFALFMSK